MNSFTVLWPPSILSDLTQIWLQARHRRAVTAAQARIDQVLTNNPLDPAAHQSEGLFRLYVWPLVVTYEVDEDQRVVEITSIRYLP
jgi:mRNA-degrading endonuclease RelE of RelBE toxin-antitoxin system